MFIKNIWYVGAWSHEVTAQKPFAIIVAGEPIVLWRTKSGEIKALQDRCPHRHAPLSKGRIEDDEIRCMYHGMKFASDGKCVHIPASDVLPPNCDVRSFPAIERDGWIWVWPGQADQADTDSIPTAWGLPSDTFVAKSGAIDYDADYQLINDNLTDLSHLDFVHETSLGLASGAKWAQDFPKVTKLKNGLRIERWFPAAQLSPDSEALYESWNAYDYSLPGIFMMSSNVYPEGTAKACNFGPPAEESQMRRFEQQAVTPTTPGKSRYMFSSGALASEDGAAFANSEQFFEVVMAAFAEDKEIIEAQQKIWDLTSEDEPKAFIPQDKAPAMFRRMISDRLKQEAANAASVAAE